MEDFIKRFTPVILFVAASVSLVHYYHSIKKNKLEIEKLEGRL